MNIQTFFFQFIFANIWPRFIFSRNTKFLQDKYNLFHWRNIFFLQTSAPHHIPRFPSRRNTNRVFKAFSHLLEFCSGCKQKEFHPQQTPSFCFITPQFFMRIFSINVFYIVSVANASLDLLIVSSILFLCLLCASVTLKHSP